MGHAQESQAAAGMARTNALRALSRRINTASLRQGFAEATERGYKDETESALSLGAGVGNASGIGGESGFSVTQTSDRAFLIFNPLPYPRAEIVEVKVWNTSLDEARLVVTGEQVHPQRVQVLEKGRYWGHDYMTVAFPVQVPALGYRVVCVSDRLAELGLVDDDTHLADPWAGMGGAARKHAPQDYVLENAFLKVELDPASGGLVSLVDKRTGREWAPDGGLMGVFQYCVEAYVGMSAWVIGPFLTREDLMDDGSLKKIHDGPYVQTFRWTRRLHQQTPGYPGNETLLELDITVRQGVPRVDFRLRVDWREMGHPEHGVPHLKVRFPLALEDPQPTYEIPYGAIGRDLVAAEEVPAQRWVDVSEEGGGSGVTLVNTSKYGFNLEGNSLNMTLLRASVDPDPLPDLGEHIIEYALVPHGTGWTVGDCTREGEGLNEPLTVTSCDFHAGRLPSHLSLVSVVQTNVRLTAFKKSRDGEAVILRLVEVDGQATEAEVTLGPELLPRHTVPVMADLMERPLEDGDDDLHLVGNALHVKVPAYGIVTVRLEGGTT
jgi:alpha-mannosidase